MDNINNKRKNINDCDSLIPRKAPHHTAEYDDDDDNFLTLSLSSPQLNLHPPPLPPPSQPPPLPPPPAAAAPSRRRGRRRNPSRSPTEGKNATVPPPFPWATNRRATVHRLSHLRSKQITAISGEVQCKRCERRYTMEFDLESKFDEIGSFMARNRSEMHHRAPKVLLNPTLPRCRYCDQENSVRPLISDKKRSINWLFLLLGKMLGCCTLDQLKYFCKHTKNHRTGAKDRVLFLTYLGLCKQLDPNGPFSI